MTTTATTTAPPVFDTVTTTVNVITTQVSNDGSTWVRFVVDGDWKITDVAHPDDLFCLPFSTGGQTVTCYASDDLPAGEQEYTISLKATKVTPAPGAMLTWTYHDQNGEQTQTDPIVGH